MMNISFKRGGLKGGLRTQTNTNNQSCQRKRDAVFHCAKQQCHCSCEMVLQNPFLHFPVLHFPALQNGPPFSGPVFSKILVLQIPVLLFPVLHFQRAPRAHVSHPLIHITRHGGAVSRRTANTKLTKLYVPARKGSQKKTSCTCRTRKVGGGTT